MSMFCKMKGNKHFTRDVAPITHYLRHACIYCSYHAISSCAHPVPRSMDSTPATADTTTTSRCARSVTTTATPGKSGPSTRTRRSDGEDLPTASKQL